MKSMSIGDGDGDGESDGDGNLESPVALTVNRRWGIDARFYRNAHGDGVGGFTITDITVTQ